MPKLSAQTMTLLDGDVRLVKRRNSRAWQAAFKIVLKRYFIPYFGDRCVTRIT